MPDVFPEAALRQLRSMILADGLLSISSAR